mmetsp:Transcript_7605/g.10791  ORF Transcript_7605/g.10791 Transcript_7605/m.10791 type:complete len:180 (+) Transcript_7605:138-677(+)
MATHRACIETLREQEKFREDCLRDQSEQIWNKPKGSFDFKKIEDNLESTIGPDTLTRFLQSQEEEKLKIQARKEFETTVMSQRVPKAKVRPANLAYSVREGAPYKSKAGTSTIKIGDTVRKKKSLKDPTKRVCRYEHLGKWHFSKIENCEAWSCCMNTEKKSKGCSLVEVFDKSKWQYD